MWNGTNYNAMTSLKPDKITDKCEIMLINNNIDGFLNELFLVINSFIKINSRPCSKVYIPYN